MLDQLPCYPLAGSGPGSVRPTLMWCIIFLSHKCSVVKEATAEACHVSITVSFACIRGCVGFVQAIQSERGGSAVDRPSWALAVGCGVLTWLPLPPWRCGTGAARAVAGERCRSVPGSGDGCAPLACLGAAVSQCYDGVTVLPPYCRHVGLFAINPVSSALKYHMNR